MPAATVTVEQVIEAIRKSHGLLATAARDLGVTRQTVYNYVKRYRRVAHAVDEARDSILDMAEGQLFSAVQKGSIPAMMFLLKTVGRTRGYVDRQEITGADGQALKIKLDWGDNVISDDEDAESA